MPLTFTTLATDSFNRANENPLGNGVWTVLLSSPLQIVSHAVEAVASFFGVEKYSGISWPNNQWAEIKIASFDTSGGSFSELEIELRCDDTVSNSYQITLKPGAGNSLVIKNVGGVQTTLATISQAAIVGDTWRFAIVGHTWFVFQNGVQVSTGTDASVASGNVAIVVAYNVTQSDTSVVNFAGGSVTQPGVGGLSPNTFETNDYGPGVNSPRTSIMGTNGRTKILR